MKEILAVYLASYIGEMLFIKVSLAFVGGCILLEHKTWSVLIGFVLVIFAFFLPDEQTLKYIVEYLNK